MSFDIGLGASDRDSYGFAPIYQAILSKVGAEIIGCEASLPHWYLPLIVGLL